MRSTPVFLSSKKSTNVRLNLGQLVGYLGNKLTGQLFPARAEARLRAAMLTPRRPAEPNGTDLVRADNAARVPYGSRWLKVWSFGAGPTILLAHGWSGHAAQFDAWIEPLVTAGHRVVLFDAPAHGRSGGTDTNIMDMAGAVQHVAGLYGPVHAIVAHSFGAPATLVALQHGLKVERLVLIAAPLSLTKHSIFVAHALGFPMAVRGRMQRKMERALEFRWDEAESDKALAALAEERRLDVLLIHDRRDREVPFAAAERLAVAAPAARLIATDGLGHNRILRSATVIADAIGFVGGAARADAAASRRAA
jgi:pimeloyl-ACP methyl ester carboxylesterase